MISTGQVTASGTASSVLCVVPPGPCLAILSSDPGNTATAYVGVSAPGGSVTSSNGIPLGAGAQISIAGYPASRGGTLSVIAAGTATAAVGWMISRS